MKEFPKNPSPLPKEWIESPLAFRIKNTSKIDKVCNIFGYGKFLHTANMGSDAEISVTPDLPKVTYLQMLCHSAFEPFVMPGFYMASENKNQFKQVLRYYAEYGGGARRQNPLIVDFDFSTDNDLDAMSGRGYEKEFAGRYTINWATRLEFLVLAETEIKLMIYQSENQMYTRGKGRIRK
jgi:hypothetical protein